mmetsp:Transcript_58708/g.67807  ORF Transcript_58708/g.67807 Transcript_58708/m.67807 type:complete len:232 (-) Transcript_58708:39-734(-)
MRVTGALLADITGLFRTTRVLCFEVADVRQRVLLERKRRELSKKVTEKTSSSSASSSTALIMSRSSDELPEDAALAAECGLLPPSTFNISELRRNKEALDRMVQDQRARRLAKKAAFEAWQEGQREKGQAHRLARQAKKAEKWKRQHYNKTHHRLVASTATQPPPQTERRETTMESPARNVAEDPATRRLLRSHNTREVRTSADLLNVASLRRNVPAEHRIFLSVSRGMYS